MVNRSFAAASAVALFFLFAAMPASAALVFSGSFDDSTAAEADGDSIVLHNDPTSASYITQVVIDLTTAAATVTFDPTDSPFTSIGGSDLATGLFNVFFAGNQLLTLEFSDFAPGETFSFTVDLDDNNTRVDSNRIDGATVTATFAAGGGTPVTAAMIDPPTGSGRNASWSGSSPIPVPEPRAGLLLALGLTALAWRERPARRGWAAPAS